MRWSELVRGGRNRSEPAGTGRKRPENDRKRSEIAEIAGDSWKWSVKWSGMIRNGQLVEKWSGNGRKWSEMVKNGREWSVTVGKGRKRLETVGNGSETAEKWSEMVGNGREMVGNG